jgi:hypothetical protein
MWSINRNKGVPISRKKNELSGSSLVDFQLERSRSFIYRGIVVISHQWNYKNVPVYKWLALLEFLSTGEDLGPKMKKGSSKCSNAV